MREGGRASVPFFPSRPSFLALRLSLAVRAPRKVFPSALRLASGPPCCYHGLGVATGYSYPASRLTPSMPTSFSLVSFRSLPPSIPFATAARRSADSTILPAWKCAADCIAFRAWPSVAPGIRAQNGRASIGMLSLDWLLAFRVLARLSRCVASPSDSLLLPLSPRVSCHAARVNARSTALSVSTPTPSGLRAIQSLHRHKWRVRLRVPARQGVCGASATLSRIVSLLLAFATRRGSLLPPMLWHSLAACLAVSGC